MSEFRCRMSSITINHAVVSDRLVPVCLSVCFKTAEDTNFKFGRRVPSDRSDMSLTNISEKWAWSWSRDPVNFGALNANSSKMAKVTNF